MKRLLLATLILLTGCLGQAARQHVEPALVKSQWPAVKKWVELGPAAAPDGYADFDAAATAGDMTKLTALANTWLAVKIVAEQNIQQHGDIADAQWLEMESINQYDKTLRAAAGK